MRQIILAATTFTLLLVGCEPLVAQRQQEVFKQAQAISAECHEKRLSGQLKGFADAARCSNDRMRQIWADAGFPYMDLVDLMAADRLAVAERMDKSYLPRKQMCKWQSSASVWLTKHKGVILKCRPRFRHSKYNKPPLAELTEHAQREFTTATGRGGADGRGM